MTGGEGRPRAWGRLLRLPNLVTAVADVAAGLALAAGPLVGEATLLLAAGPCLYGGGVVLNDWFDRRVDALERPSRPLPSGEVSPPAALAAGLSLLAAGVALASAAGTRAGVIAAAIALLALAYDAGVKRWAVGATLAIAACRLLDVGLGLSAAPLGRAGLLYPLPLALFVTAAMPLSRVEVTGGERGAPRLSLLLLAAAPTSAALLAGGGLLAGRAVAAVALVAAAAAFGLRPALRTPTPEHIQGAIRAILLGLIPLDAALALGGGRPWLALPILLLLLPARRLARRIAMT